MLPEPINILLVLLWAIIAWYIVSRSWGKKRDRVGLTITYVAFFAMAHWLPMLAILLPWYDPIFDLEYNLIGFYYSLIAIISFAFGTFWLSKFLRNFHSRLLQRQNISNTPNAPNTSAPELSSLPAIYILIGLVFTFLIFPIIKNMPTLSAFGAGVNSLFQVGLFLFLWQGYRRQSKIQILLAWSIVIIWPIVGVVTSGFLGFATSFVIAFVIFNVSLLDRPFRYLLPLVLFAYIAVSFFIGYWSIRSDIRGTLWYGSEQVTTDTRANIATDLIQAIQFFDVTNPDHLFPLDERLSMNHLTGRTVKRIEAGTVDYAYGETVFQALTMVIPRMVWPNKPVTVGGQVVVRQYAGYGILSGSIAPGHLMEFYLNFGMLGVILGFIFVGALIGIIDQYCARQLKLGNLFNFAMVMVAALALVGSATTYLVTFVGATLSGLITVYLVNVFVRSFLSIPSKRYTTTVRMEN